MINKIKNIFHFHKWKYFDLEYNDTNYEPYCQGSMRVCEKCNRIEQYFIYNSSITCDTIKGYKLAKDKKLYYSKLKLNLLNR